jgi:hypothetical protein
VTSRRRRLLETLDPLGAQDRREVEDAHRHARMHLECGQKSADGEGSGLGRKDYIRPIARGAVRAMLRTFRARETVRYAANARSLRG